MVLITILAGVYKPTYNWRAPSCNRMMFNKNWWKHRGMYNSINPFASLFWNWTTISWNCHSHKLQPVIWKRWWWWWWWWWLHQDRHDCNDHPQSPAINIDKLTNKMNIDPHLPIWTNNSSKDMFKIFESNAAPTNQNRKHMEKVFYRLNNL